MQKANIYFLSLITIFGTVQPFGWSNLNPRNIPMPDISIPGLRSQKPSQEQENSNEQAKTPEEESVATPPETSPTVNLSKIELQKMLAEAVKAGKAEYQSQISQLIKENNGTNPQEIDIIKIEKRILDKARKDYYKRIEEVNKELSELAKKSREAKKELWAHTDIEHLKTWMAANKDWRSATKLRLGIAGFLGLRGTTDYLQKSPDIELYRIMATRISLPEEKEQDYFNPYN